MEQIRIVCPNCQSKLTIKQIPSIGEKMLSCPICRFRAKVAIFMQQSLNDKKQFQNDDDEPTQVNFSEMDNRTIGSLFYGNEEFALHKGDNTIGRRASTGQAEVQISDDRYMSRQHAIITIKEGGSGLEHQLRPTNPKNPIKINGSPLGNEDVIILKWRDKLSFGHTELIFDRPKAGDEEYTIIDQ